MPRRARRRGDPERGEQLRELGGGPQPEAPERRLDPNTGGGAMDNSPDGPSLSEARSERKDFDDGANALWTLYSKEAQAHDEALFQGMLADMSGIPTFAGLFAAVLTSFLVDSLKNLRPDPAEQSVYYQQQSVAMLAQISQQIASIPQVSATVPSTPPQPYPAFHPSNKDVVVNTLWLSGLVYSLAAAFFATLVQQRIRSYLQVFQRYDHPLKRARFRQYFFDRSRSVRVLASLATWFIRVSVILFFWGLCITTLRIGIVFGIVPAMCISSFLLMLLRFVSMLARTLQTQGGVLTLFRF
ncbi:hypothetical protein EDB85DRAFT_1484280 [Lactarius pseudohatsudake]|nr:hypothetical protein EDB85DRAFT_1484280 [Lactarius pseudohatsudake]